MVTSPSLVTPAASRNVGSRSSQWVSRDVSIGASIPASTSGPCSSRQSSITSARNPARIFAAASSLLSKVAVSSLTSGYAFLKWAILESATVSE